MKESVTGNFEFNSMFPVLGSLDDVSTAGFKDYGNCRQNQNTVYSVE